jgi:hypothetical protein
VHLISLYIHLLIKQLLEKQGRHDRYELEWPDENWVKHAVLVPLYDHRTGDIIRQRMTRSIDASELLHCDQIQKHEPDRESSSRSAEGYVGVVVALRLKT